MTISSYEELLEHIGHEVVAVTYGSENATLECEDCSEVLFEFFNPDYEEEDPE